MKNNGTNQYKKSILVLFYTKIWILIEDLEFQYPWTPVLSAPLEVSTHICVQYIFDIENGAKK